MRKSDPPYTDVKRTITGEYSAFYKGKCIGIYPTHAEADAALWNGPVGDDLVAFQRDVDIKHAIYLAEAKRRKQEKQRHGKA
jgi:hypothetical protein